MNKGFGLMTTLGTKLDPGERNKESAEMNIYQCKIIRFIHITTLAVWPDTGERSGQESLHTCINLNHINQPIGYTTTQVTRLDPGEGVDHKFLLTIINQNRISKGPGSKTSMSTKLDPGERQGQWPQITNY